MSILPSPAPDTPAILPKERRVRRLHNKTRTGCVTCKIRRKKCDETKPACLRCKSTGRTCDGYPQILNSGSGESTNPSSPSSSSASCVKKALPVPKVFAGTWQKSNETKMMNYPGVQDTTSVSTPVSKHPISTRIPSGGSEEPPHIAPFAAHETATVESSTDVFGSLPSTDSISSTDVSIFTPTDHGSIDCSFVDLSSTPVSPQPKSPIGTQYTEHSAINSPSPTTTSSVWSYARSSHCSSNISESDCESRYDLERQRNLYDKHRYRFRPPSMYTVPASVVSGILSAQDVYHFTHFSQLTGPSFASYFDSTMWKRFMLRSALSHPTVLIAAAAVGAVHRRFNLGISREAFEMCAVVDRLHKQALKALDEFKRHLSKNEDQEGHDDEGRTRRLNDHDRDTLMCTEMLLGFLNVFQENYAEGVKHLYHGLEYVVARPMTLMSSESSYCTPEPGPASLRTLVAKLHRRVLELFHEPPQILATWETAQDLPPVPLAFQSIEQARDYVFTDVYWLLNVPARVWKLVKDRRAAQRLTTERILRWTKAFAELLRGSERTALELRKCVLLRYVRSTNYLLSYMLLFKEEDDSEQTSYVDIHHTCNFSEEHSLAIDAPSIWQNVGQSSSTATNISRLKFLSQNMLDGTVYHGNEHSSSFDTAVGPPRLNVTLPEASNKTRHLIQSPIRNDDTGIWGSLGVYSIAEKLSAIEEHAVIQAAKRIVPLDADPKWVDITLTMEHRKLVLKYCRPDEHGLGMVWTQEWWAF